MLLPPEKKESADDDYIIAKKKPEQRHDDDTRYIGALTSIELAKTSGKCVLVDPGQRDVLYCMKETSTAKQKEVLVFRKTNRSKWSRHFRILGKLTKPSMIKNAIIYCRSRHVCKVYKGKSFCGQDIRPMLRK